MFRDRRSQTRAWAALVLLLCVGCARPVADRLDRPHLAAASTRDCRRQTPLPADVRLVPPAPEVPEVAARFAGAWIGMWRDKGREALCQTLVVEEVLANGYARLVVSHGTSADWDLRLPHFWYVTGRIVDGVLRVRLPIPGSPRLVYAFEGQTLQGLADRPDDDPARVSLTPISDLRQVGCGQHSGRLRPASATGHVID